MGFYIDMIDVGEGDSFLLTLDAPSGREARVLIDAGTQAGGEKVVEFLSDYAPSGLDLIIATHLDNDHIGGMKEVIENFPFGDFAFNVPPALAQGWFPLRESLESYRGIEASERLIKAIDMAKDLIQALSDHGKAPSPVLAGQLWECGDVVLNVLNPTRERLQAAWEDKNLLSVVQSGLGLPVAKRLYEILSKGQAPPTSPENDASVVVEIVYQGSPYALMAADAGAAVLAEITADRTYKFLKAPHHGSDTGLTNDLVLQWKPDTAYIPVGDNPHGHPSCDVLDMLRNAGVRTYCSGRTKHCRSKCRSGGFGNLCHKKDKESRQGWSAVDASKCANNNGT